MDASAATPSGSAASTTGATAPPNVYVTVAPTPSATEGSHLGHQIISDLLWPMVILLVVLMFRRQLSDLISGRGQSRIKSFSFAGLSVELAPGSSGSPALLNIALAKTDIRKAGSEQDVNDSTQQSFYDQINLRSPMAYALVDLGTGQEWLTSRLYILAVIMQRMRGVQFLVFVAQRDTNTREFLGICYVNRLHWRLARWYPRLEAALVAGESRAWGNAASPPRIDNDEGRFNTAAGAAELLRGFLAAVQQSVPPVIEPQSWQSLGPNLYEYAEWLSVDLLQRVLGEILETDAVELRDVETEDEAQRRRIITDHLGDWVAVTKDGEFHGAIERRLYLESIARG
jgi:hypothetical protein